MQPKYEEENYTLNCCSNFKMWVVVGQLWKRHQFFS